VRSYCEDYIVRNIIMQSEFHFDVWFNIYNIFIFQTVLHKGWHKQFVSSCMNAVAHW
jgi:hypothetical protein